MKSSSIHRTKEFFRLFLRLTLPLVARTLVLGLEEQVKTKKLDYYTKKLTTESFLKLLLFAQLQEVESLHALGDCLFDDQLQKGIDLESISISQLSRRING
ncbi:DUF4372 domain-containing protein, partial [Metabacillus arenae]|uniref:DUF4372 domain-containing protein n=1 Tax=Metabacillus arenae TaxID=2771434 RepID=UPI0037C5D644